MIDSAALMVANAIRRTVDARGKVLVCGNGGSAAQASHLAGELLGRFRAGPRPPIACVSLLDPSVVTCIANDFGYEEVFARQIRALGNPGDLLIVLTTSGRSVNVIRAIEAALFGGACVVALTGERGLPIEYGRAEHFADRHRTIACGGDGTAAIQAEHLRVLHEACELLENMMGDTDAA